MIKPKTNMKQLGFLFSVMLIMTGVIISCSKKKNDPQPAERKQYAWVAGMMDSTGYGMILYSADGGETWVRQGQGSAALQNTNVSDIWAVDENNVWAVCSGNVVLKTLDGGQTWTRVPMLANSSGTNLMSVSIVNKTNIWISGSGGTVYNSVDNGITWTMFDTTFFHNGGMQGIWAISPQSSSIAIASVRALQAFRNMPLVVSVVREHADPFNLQVFN